MKNIPVCELMMQIRICALYHSLLRQTTTAKGKSILYLKDIYRHEQYLLNLIHTN